MSANRTFAQQFLAEVTEIISRLETNSIEKAAAMLAATRTAGGRLFILGVGGSAANASHAVNDFRKIADIEAYAPTDNVAELTARTNDEGWATVFDRWLRTSRLCSNDLVLVLSVGGGNLEANVSANLVAALKYAKSAGAKIIGIVGRDGGYTAQVADACILIPTVNAERITPHVEAFQAIVWHLLVTHPAVKLEQTKWESTAPAGKQRRAVFLDRDGVINRAIVRNGRPHPPATLDELEILPDVPEALSELKGHGFDLVVITNQPDVARGTQTRDAVEVINRKLASTLPLDDIFVCYHTDQDNCSCRKPKPGMLLDAARKYDIDLSVSFLVGDRWRDIEAGKNAGCKTILIDGGYHEKRSGQAPDASVGSLREAASWIIHSAAKGAAR
ncbi:MAG: HAD-IIIA family hydrolase [Candidatus Acidiferrales bacterium]